MNGCYWMVSSVCYLAMGIVCPCLMRGLSSLNWMHFAYSGRVYCCEHSASWRVRQKRCSMVLLCHVYRGVVQTKSLDSV